MGRGVPRAIFEDSPRITRIAGVVITAPPMPKAPEKKPAAKPTRIINRNSAVSMVRPSFARSSDDVYYLGVGGPDKVI